VLVIAQDALLRYKFDDPQVRRYPPISTPEGLFAWSDRRRPDSFATHTANKSTLEEYTLPLLREKGAPDSSAVLEKLASQETNLPGFDLRIFSVLADGKAIYSTASGLVRSEHGAEQPTPPFHVLSGLTTLVFADPSPSDYWTSDLEGNLKRWTLNDPASQPLKAHVPGVVIDTAVDGERLAVLSMTKDAQSYRPMVTVFVDGHQTGSLVLAPSAGNLGQPKLDLCLISGRPWIVVGGGQWLQLLDLDPPRLLAEW